MIAAQYRTSSRSSLISTVPWTSTKLNGGCSSSKHIATRGSRRMALPFAVWLPVLNSRSSPSSATHTGATSGLPSLATTASFAVLAGKAPTNSFHQPSGAFARSDMRGSVRLQRAEQPAVDEDLRAIDVRRRLAGEEDAQADHVGGHTQAAERVHARGGLAHLRRPRLGDVG